MADLPKSKICLAYLVLFFTFTSLQAQGTTTELGGGGRSRSSSEEYVPVQSVVYRLMSPAAEEQPHQPFQVCGSGCRCCAASNKSNCVDTMKCCFHINCNLPGKPYGTCAMSPLSCGCGANNCSAPGRRASSSLPSSPAHLLF